VANAQQQVDAWWASLSPPQQQNPVNEAGTTLPTEHLARAGEILASADNAINTIATSTVQYSMDKRPKDPGILLSDPNTNSTNILCYGVNLDS
jgi:hypothetical protein